MTVVSELVSQLGLSYTVASWLEKQGFQPGAALDRWLDPKLSHLTSPAEMADLEQAAERICRAIEKQERIAVFGDYDCDGMTSAAIVTEVIRALGGQVQTLLASRFEGGYGFSEVALKKVLDAKTELLITCDCGSSDHERLHKLKQAGVDAVVIDHHLVPDEPLPVVAFLNPHRPDCGFPYKGLASCGLALFVATALRRRMDVKLDLRQWLDLVAVGTIADVAPLDGDNRALVRAGLKRLSKEARVGLHALALKGSRGRELPVGVEEVSFQIAPRLNAPGRLGSPEPALRLLMEHDAVRAWEQAEAVEAMSTRRRALQQKIIDQAMAQVQANGWDSAPCLLLADPDWHFGVVGIVAGRLAEHFSKPTVVIALEGDEGRGSARAPTGFQLYDSLAACSSYMTGFGGHQAAAGLHLKSDGVAALREAWSQACAEQLQASPLPSDLNGYDLELDRRDDLRDVLRDLERLEPTGQGNPAPRILVRDVLVRSAREVKGHLKLELGFAGQTLSGFAPRMGDQSARMAGARLNLTVQVKRDHWRGGEWPELLVLAYEIG